MIASDSLLNREHVELCSS